MDKFFIDLQDSLNSEFRDLRDILNKIISSLKVKGTYYGAVLTVYELDSPEYTAYGRGAVSVLIPDLRSQAMIARPAHEGITLPKEGELIIVQNTGVRLDDFIYWGKFIIPYELPGLEEISRQIVYDTGFVDAISPYKYGGWRLQEADENLGDDVIVDSRREWIIGARRSKQELDLSVDESWRIVAATGDGGEIFIGSRDPLVESEGAASGASTNISLDAGVSGTVDLLSTTGNIGINTQGDVTITAGSDSTEPAVLGEQLESLLEDILAEIALITVPTPLGNSGPPNNASNFTGTLTSRIADILSAQFKHN